MGRWLTYLRPERASRRLPPRLHPVDETAAVAYQERRYSSDYRLYRLGTDARSREWFIVLGGDDDDPRGDTGMCFPTVRLYPGRGTPRQKTMSPLLHAIMHQQPVPHIYIAELTIHVDTVDAANVGQRRKQEGDGVGTLLVYAVQQLARDTGAAYVRGELAERDAFTPTRLARLQAFYRACGFTVRMYDKPEGCKIGDVRWERTDVPT